MNPAIFTGLASLAGQYPFTVTSFTTGRHSVSSAHYTGHAADIVPTSNDRSIWIAVRAFLNNQGGSAMCESKTTGQNVPDCNAADVNHIHWTN